MSHLKSACFKRAVVAVLLLGSCPYVQAQSPYGRASRQTMPFVLVEGTDRGDVWSTEIDIHNPSSQPITVRLTYFGAAGTFNAGRWLCTPQIVGPFATAEFPLRSACPALTPFGINYGRLELSALPERPGPSDDPAAVAFLTSARVFRLGGRYFSVEGFPQGNLSGNKGFAKVTGLKSGLLGGSQWQSRCYAAALNEHVPVFVRLVDANGQPLGTATANLDDPNGSPPIEMQPFVDVFTAVGAPPGNYSNVTALFSTAGGGGGAGVFGLCRIINTSFDVEAFEVAKYADNNDEGRQHSTAVSQTSYGKPFRLVSEVDDDDLTNNRLSNLHLAYFQHPDRVTCRVQYSCPQKFCTFDMVQVRLIDPDGNVAAGPAGVMQNYSFTVDLEEKSQRHAGRNGRWLIEVAPDRLPMGGQCQAWDKFYDCLRNGGPYVTPYELDCSSGNGHTQLDIVGQCSVGCQKDPKSKGEAVCAFAKPQSCLGP